MALSPVRHFYRTLEGDLGAHEEAGWLEWGRELIPSLPNEPIVLLEWDPSKGKEPRLPEDTEQVSAHPSDKPVRGLKSDDGKDRWDLLFVMLSGPLHDVMRGLMYGAKKYKEDPNNPNFQKVTDPDRRFGNAAMRHLFADLNGEEIDPESGIPHLSLAAINCLFLRWHRQHKERHG